MYQQLGVEKNKQQALKTSYLELVEKVESLEDITTRNILAAETFQKELVNIKSEISAFTKKLGKLNANTSDIQKHLIKIERQLKHRAEQVSSQNPALNY